jgi:hypothetical protein
MMAAFPKTDDVTHGKPPTKAEQPPRSGEELRAWDFIKVGLAFDLIVAAVIVFVSLGPMTPDTVPVGLAVFALVSIAIWGGLGLVAVPMLLARRVRRAWARRLAKHRAGVPGTWDDWIDGPRPG